MFKIFVISMLTFLVTSKCTKAQHLSENQSFNLGFDVSIGTTTKNSPFGYALGIDLLLTTTLSDRLSTTASFGYTRLLTKDTSPIADYDFIPLKGALKIFPTSTNIYLTALIGAGFGIQKGVKTSLLFGGGAGYQWEKSYDVSLKYEGYQQSIKSTTYQPLNGQFALSFTYYF